MDWKQLTTAQSLPEFVTNQGESFKKLHQLFTDWNSKINLSAIRDEEGIYIKHFLDSVMVAKFFDLADKKILDVGCGGGYPSLPLGIIFPSAQITGLDSVGKKLKAVQNMANELSLNITTINERAETLGHDPEYREQFDVIVCRAVAPWTTLLEITLPFLKVGGKMIAYQTPSILDDVFENESVAERLGGMVMEVFESDYLDLERRFVVLKKFEKTPKKFPRAVGEPKHNPLKA
ncbi:16S rRNA (guanine(527)-N(7))-methyltransferase RsmG [bacterium DOLZORAL124_38_8]|nr:MAG: 16S rRNA (guanine(527)-N(7))-methyltransferase RsmG [bacterium DOLZORAL124_38_8]